MVIIGENESQTNINRTTAPFEQTVLNKQCGSLRNMHALTHGSEPNYIGMTSGTYPSWALCDQPPNTVDSDCPQSPSSLIDGPSLFGQLAAAYGAAGWRTYAESMPTACGAVDGTKYRASTGQIRFEYVARHNPAVYYRGLTSCVADDVALGNSRTMKGAFYSDARAGALPKVSFVVPNNLDNGHDTTLTAYDNFLSPRCDSCRRPPTIEVAHWTSSSRSTKAPQPQAHRPRPGKTALIRSLSHRLLRAW